MLVISRKLGERINVGDEVEVTVLQIRGNKIRLGVTAPRCIAIERLEKYTKLNRMAQTVQEPRSPVSLLMSD